MTDLRKLSRLLLDLKSPEDFLRQYPQLAAKLAAVMEKAETHKTGVESAPTTKM
jgi:hypothetical protein